MTRYIFTLLLLFGFSNAANAKGNSNDDLTPVDSIVGSIEIDSLRILANEKQFAASTSDEEQYRLSKSLAEELYFFSFRQFENDELRISELEQALKYAAIAGKFARTESFRAMVCAVRFERAYFYNTKEMIASLNWCKSELDSIFKTDLTNPMASLIYGALCYEISQVSSYKKFMAKLLYEPLPEDLTLDKALLNLLHAKRNKIYPVFVNYRLAQVYLALGNHKYAEIAMQTALSEPEVYPYFDAHFKKQTEKVLNAYKSRNK